MIFLRGDSNTLEGGMNWFMADEENHGNVFLDNVVDKGDGELS